MICERLLRINQKIQMVDKFIQPFSSCPKMLLFYCSLFTELLSMKCANKMQIILFNVNVSLR